MKKYIITAVSITGEKALIQHVKETHKLHYAQKKILEYQGWKQEVNTGNPYRIILTLDNKDVEEVIEDSFVTKRIVLSLQKNGAEEDKDYIIIVKKEVI
jgi:hypothetical protein